MKHWSQSLFAAALCTLIAAAPCPAEDPQSSADTPAPAGEEGPPEPGLARRLIELPIKVLTAPVKLGVQLLPQSHPERHWTGDFDGMAKRRAIRALVVHSKTQYFVDRGTQRGISYEMLTALEEHVNRTLGRKRTDKVHVFFIPVSREEIIPALLEGRGDIAAAALTITPERQQQIDFSVPLFKNVNEIAVTGPSSPELHSIDDLSGKEVFVRRSSSYWEHLEALNERFAKEGKKPVGLREAPEDLEDDDLLEMLNAGLFGITVVDEYKVKLWGNVYKDLVGHPEITLNTGGEIAWAFRKDSPKLAAEIAEFAKTHKQGTTFGNTILKRYIGSTQYIARSTSPEEIAKFRALIDIFRKYSDQYGLDFLLMVAQGYQESRLDHNARSQVGAIGVMQVMPATGKELAVGDITQLEPNIHAGVKYIRQMMDRYYANEPMTDVNKILFTFASYNAGPARIRSMRKEATNRGLDPNVWFNNVEVVTADKVGAEPVTYVSNIYKYYVAYKLVVEDMEKDRQAKERLKG
jgi:membrane-bound lytic murein transglycosylase MltF